MGMKIVLESFECDGIVDIIVPEGVTHVSAGVFRGCRTIESVRLPSTLQAIAHDAFNGCIALSEIQIPNGVEVIGKRAFRGCSKLGRVVLPDTLDVLEPYAFSLCKSLKSLEGGNVVSVVGKECFAGCKALSNIPFESTLRSIGQQAFSSCSSLQRLNLGESLEVIGQEAFRSCKSLEVVVLPDDLESAGKNIFSGCDPNIVIVGFERLVASFPDAFPMQKVEALGVMRPQDFVQRQRDFAKIHEQEIIEKRKKVAELELELEACHDDKKTLFGLRLGKGSSQDKDVSMRIKRELQETRRGLKKLEEPDWDTLVEQIKERP